MSINRVVDEDGSITCVFEPLIRMCPGPARGVVTKALQKVPDSVATADDKTALLASLFSGNASRRRIADALYDFADIARRSQRVAGPP